LQDKIEAQLARLKAAPRLIQSFFKAPSVAYITDRWVIELYALVDAMSAVAPKNTEIGYQKVGWTMTNGIKPTARAGGIWTLNILKIAIEQSMVTVTPKNSV
jgi:hypothetical protein